MQIHSAGPPPREGIEPHINVNDRSAAIAGARLHTRLQLQMLCCNCRCSAAIADARGCNCRYLAAIADARLQLQNYSVAIADSKYTLQALRPGEDRSKNSSILQLQIANTLCRLSAQAKLQRRPPLQIHRKIGLLSRLVRMYCSHLLDAASVLNCRWLYYTQEDANGMYAAPSPPSPRPPS